jgi:hypothetical protein
MKKNKKETEEKQEKTISLPPVLRIKRKSVKSKWNRQLGDSFKLNELVIVDKVQKGVIFPMIRIKRNDKSRRGVILSITHFTKVNGDKIKI